MSNSSDRPVMFRRACIIVLTLIASHYCIARDLSSASLRITAFDESNAAVTKAQIQLWFQGKSVNTTTTNTQGEAEFLNLPPGSYKVVISRQGFETTTRQDIMVNAGQTMKLTLVLKVATVKQEINVAGTTDSPVAQSSSVGTQLPRDQVKEIPGRPVTIIDALPLVPGVVRAPNGTVLIYGSNEHHSGFVVNSVNVTDPVTGQFQPTVPIDSVDTVTVYKTPYLAQYGGFTSGIVSVDTRRGGDKWHYELNDPFPEFRVRSAHIVGLREITPRVNFNGPLIANRLYFADAGEYVLRKQAVRSLQYPFNEMKEQSFNSFTQIDYLVSPKHILTGTFHLAPLKKQFVNLDFFNPQPVTPDFVFQGDTTSLLDRLTVNGGVLQSTLSLNRVDASVLPRGKAVMKLAPTGNSGNYFNEQHRRASRVEWRENFFLPPLQWAGTHNFQFGTTLSHTQFRASIKDRPINILDTSGQLRRRIEFTNTQPIRRQDDEVAAFGQDHWQVGRKLALDAGIRMERQDLSRTLRLAPRVGFAFTPWASDSTVVRGGYGIFYDTIPLNIFSFNQFPEEIITTYDLSSPANSQRRRYGRFTRPVRGHSKTSVLRVLNDAGGRFSPSSAAWNIEIEHAISNSFHVRANYLQSESDGLFVINREAIQGQDFLVLRDTGRSFYHQLELGAHFTWKQGDISGSYVRSHTAGDLNEFDNFLGNFPLPIVSANRFSALPGDIPNRILVWSQFKLPLKMHITPLVEYRSGFPYQVRDVMQNYVAQTHETRFPSYFSLDARIAKEFKVMKNHALEGSVSITNITNHFNPLAVHSNTADPQFGRFFAYYDRRARIDLDVKF